MPAARSSSAAAPRAASGSRPEPPRRLAVQRRHRLSRSRDFDAVYRQGRSVSTRFLVLYWFPREDDADGEPRLGLAVPKAVGNAVVRNRVKRQLREAWRELADAASRPGRDYVLVARPGPRRARTSARLRVARRAGRRGARRRPTRVKVRSASRSSTPGATRFGLLTPAGTCKYHPTCSQYALDALREHGLVRGLGPRRLAAPALQPVEPRRRRPREDARPRRAGDRRSASSRRSRTSLDLASSTYLHDTVGLPWAWSIVALTVIVRILLVPLTVRQIHSMQSLQAHAPEMKEIQQKYKGDRQQQNEELMKFYKENKINPAASCLPIVAQIPVFIALFFVLRGLREGDPPAVPAAPTSTGSTSSTSPTPRTTAGGPLLLVIYAVSQSRRRTSCRRRWTRRSGC